MDWSSLPDPIPTPPPDSPWTETDGVEMSDSHSESPPTPKVTLSTGAGAPVASNVSGSTMPAQDPRATDVSFVDHIPHLQSLVEELSTKHQVTESETTHLADSFRHLQLAVQALQQQVQQQRIPPAPLKFGANIRCTNAHFGGCLDRGLSADFEFRIKVFSDIERFAPFCCELLEANPQIDHPAASSFPTLGRGLSTLYSQQYSAVRISDSIRRMLKRFAPGELLHNFLPMHLASTLFSCFEEVQGIQNAKAGKNLMGHEEPHVKALAIAREQADNIRRTVITNATATECVTAVEVSEALLKAKESDYMPSDVLNIRSKRASAARDRDFVSLVLDLFHVVCEHLQVHSFNTTMQLLRDGFVRALTHMEQPVSPECKKFFALVAKVFQDKFNEYVFSPDATDDDILNRPLHVWVYDQRQKEMRLVVGFAVALIKGVAADTVMYWLYYAVTVAARVHQDAIKEINTPLTWSFDFNKAEMMRRLNLHLVVSKFLHLHGGAALFFNECKAFLGATMQLGINAQDKQPPHLVTRCAKASARYTEFVAHSQRYKLNAYGCNPIYLYMGAQEILGDVRFQYERMVLDGEMALKRDDFPQRTSIVDRDDHRRRTSAVDIAAAASSAAIASTPSCQTTEVQQKSRNVRRKRNKQKQDSQVEAPAASTTAAAVTTPSSEVCIYDHRCFSDLVFGRCKSGKHTLPVCENDFWGVRAAKRCGYEPEKSTLVRHKGCSHGKRHPKQCAIFALLRNPRYAARDSKLSAPWVRVRDEWRLQEPDHPFFTQHPVSHNTSSAAVPVQHHLPAQTQHAYAIHSVPVQHHLPTHTQHAYAIHNPPTVSVAAQPSYAHAPAAPPAGAHAVTAQPIYVHPPAAPPASAHAVTAQTAYTYAPLAVPPHGHAVSAPPVHSHSTHPSATAQSATAGPLNPTSVVPPEFADHVGGYRASGSDLMQKH